MVLLVHGYAEHVGRYEHVAAALTAAGYGVHGYDQEGHGRSGGRRGHVASLDGLVADLGLVHADLAERHPDLPIVLLGHSMGGLVALAYLEGTPTARVDAAVVSAPYLRNAVPTPAPLAALAPIVARLLPRLPVQRLDADTVSRDPAVVRAYDTDPFVYRGKIDARTGATLLAAGPAVITGAGRIDVPILVLHGGDDRIAALQGARDVVAALGSEDKTLEVYDGLYHEVFNEPEQDRVLADVTGWLAARLSSG